MMSLWDALRMNMMISYQELVRTFPKENAEVVLTINNAPLLVFGNYHNGKIACFMSDCSPHWGTQQFMSWPFYTALWVNILTHIAR